MKCCAPNVIRVTAKQNETGGAFGVYGEDERHMKHSGWVT